MTNGPIDPNLVVTRVNSPREEIDPSYNKLAVTRGKSNKPSNSPNPGAKSKKHRKLTKKQKIIIAIVIIIALILVGVGVWLWFLWHQPTGEEIIEEEYIEEEIEYVEPIYSNLTGLEIANAELNSSPTYCVQIPNGSTDGARPQAGLDAAAVVFEAIAESGITRFAAIFQNASVSAIGPIRSLRPYYLDWDTPFDCTIVHAGGSAEAIQALRIGGQRDLNESYTYMWREAGSGRNWNNLFTSPALLNAYNSSKGWTTSSPKTFARLTPTETTELLAQRAECANQTAEGINPEEEPTCTPYTPASTIRINFSANTSHNVAYNYDPATNTYLRSHQDGQPHMTYECSAELDKPNTKADCGNPRQVAPSVVVAMKVQQGLMADRYHTSIQTIGSGEAIIFQNGEMITGTWTKASQNAQIVFKDGAGAEIKLTPGQLWISAVPQYGVVQAQP